MYEIIISLRISLTHGSLYTYYLKWKIFFQSLPFGTHFQPKWNFSTVSKVLGYVYDWCLKRCLSARITRYQKQRFQKNQKVFSKNEKFFEKCDILLMYFLLKSAISRKRKLVSKRFKNALLGIELGFWKK